MEEIAQLFVDVRDAGGHDPPRGEQQRRKGGSVVVDALGGIDDSMPIAPTHNTSQATSPSNPYHTCVCTHSTDQPAEDFVVALLKERTITGKVVIFVQSKRSCQQLADRLKQMRHLEVHSFVRPAGFAFWGERPGGTNSPTIASPNAGVGVPRRADPGGARQLLRRVHPGPPQRAFVSLSLCVLVDVGMGAACRSCVYGISNQPPTKPA